ncbi:hypothetical protein HDU67_004106, partial [Dinochytrium kinnereticum]
PTSDVAIATVPVPMTPATARSTAPATYAIAPTARVFPPLRTAAPSACRPIAGNSFAPTLPYAASPAGPGRLIAAVPPPAVALVLPPPAIPRPLPTSPVAWSSFASTPRPAPSLSSQARTLQEALASAHVIDPYSLSLPDSSQFISGCVNSSRLDFWQRILAASPPDESARLLRWISDGIRVEEFFSPQGFAGRYKGTNYNSRRPPTRVFKNPPFSPDHSKFVTDSVLDDLRSGARRKVCPVRGAPRAAVPYIVAPTGVEPSKPRKFDDCTYLNLWMSPPPFQLEGLPSITHWSAQ